MATKEEHFRRELEEALTRGDYDTLRRLAKTAAVNADKDLGLSFAFIDGIVNKFGLGDYVGITRQGGINAQVLHGDIANIAGTYIKDNKSSITKLRAGSVHGLEENLVKKFSELEKMVQGAESKMVAEQKPSTTAPTPFKKTP